MHGIEGMKGPVVFPVSAEDRKSQGKITSQLGEEHVVTQEKSGKRTFFSNVFEGISKGFSGFFGRLFGSRHIAQPIELSSTDQSIQKKTEERLKEGTIDESFKGASLFMVPFQSICEAHGGYVFEGWNEFEKTPAPLEMLGVITKALQNSNDIFYCELPDGKTMYAAYVSREEGKKGTIALDKIKYKDGVSIEALKAYHKAQIFFNDRPTNPVQLLVTSRGMGALAHTYSFSAFPKTGLGRSQE
jgi:hypothetical protein